MFASGLGIASLWVTAVVGAGLPLGIPPEKEDPVMTRVAPDECLFYLHWAGSAVPDATSDNQTEQLLAEPEIQAVLAELDKRLTAAFQQQADDAGPGPAEGATMWSELGLTWGRRILTRPTAIFVSKFEMGETAPVIDGGAIVNLGEHAAEFQELVDKLMAEGPPGFKPVDINGAKMYQGRPEPDAPLITVGVKDGYCYVGLGEAAVEGMMERAATDPPKWLTDLTEQLAVPRRSLIGFVNIQAITEKAAPLVPGGDEAAKVLDAAGLSNITSARAVCGLDEAGFVTRAMITIDGDAKGLLSLADAKPLTDDDVAPIPRDATVALAVRLDAGKLHDLVFQILGDIDPGIVDQAKREIGEAEEELGFRLRDDLLASLGDVWCLYHSPDEGGLLLGAAAVVKVRDRDKLNGVIDKLVAQVRAEAERDEAADIRRHRRPTVKKFEFAEQEIYFVSGSEVPLAPAWCVTDDELIIGLFPQTIKSYLSRGDDYQSIAEQPAVAAALAEGDGPIKLYYQDTPALFRLAYPFVQIGARYATTEMQREGIDVDMSLFPSGESIGRHLSPDVVSVSRTAAGIEITCRETVPGSTAAPVMFVGGAVAYWTMGIEPGEAFEGVAMALNPAKAREARSAVQLKMIGLGMHNYHDVHRRMPPAVSTDDDGKPLLSWRVQILPLIDENQLYDRFHLDEPWDSEHNKALIPLMPEIYASPGSSAGPGKTNYLTIRHKDSMFPGTEQIGMRDILDGTSNTIMVVEASDMAAVTWTKPDDFTFDPMNPGRGLAGLRGDGFLVLFGDGSVRKIAATIDKDMLNKLYTRAGGEVVEDVPYLGYAGSGRPRARVDRSVDEAIGVPALPKPRDAESEPAPLPPRKTEPIPRDEDSAQPEGAALPRSPKQPVRAERTNVDPPQPKIPAAPQTSDGALSP